MSLFPEASVTVKVTVFAPILLQSKSVLSTVILSIEQLSVDPLFISATVIEALPELSIATSISLKHIASGAILSTTVTSAVHVVSKLLPSVTVSITEFTPKSSQVKVVFEAESVIVEQLSLEPLLISAAVILPLPLASNSTVMLEQIAVGGILSTTVTFAVQVETLSLVSVTVSVTVLAPKSAQEKDSLSTSKDLIPQISLEPLSISFGSNVAKPAASR